MNLSQVKKYGLLGALLKPISTFFSEKLAVFKANNITSFNLAFIMILPVISYYHKYSLLAIAIVLITYIDFLDGDVARIRGEASSFGAFYDGFTDVVFWISMRVGVTLLINEQIYMITILILLVVYITLSKFTNGNISSKIRLTRFESIFGKTLFIFNSIDMKIYLAVLLLVKPSLLIFWVVVDILSQCLFIVYEMAKIRRINLD